MKLVDVPDSKSGVVHPTCRFDSGHRHFLNSLRGVFLLAGVEPRFLPLTKRYSIVLFGRVAIAFFKLPQGSFFIGRSRMWFYLILYCQKCFYLVIFEYAGKLSSVLKIFGIKAGKIFRESKTFYILS